MTGRKFIVMQCLAAVIFSSGSGSAFGGSLFISRLATYEKSGPIRVKVLQECSPEQLLPVVFRREFLEQFAHLEVKLADDEDIARKDLGITLAILELTLPVAPGWSNQRRVVRLKGTLYRNGKVIAEVRGNSSGQGAGFMQKIFSARLSCEYLERLMEHASRNAVGRMRLMNLFPVNSGRQE